MRYIVLDTNCLNLKDIPFPPLVVLSLDEFYNSL